MQSVPIFDPSGMYYLAIYRESWKFYPLGGEKRWQNYKGQRDFLAKESSSLQILLKYHLTELLYDKD